MIGMKIANVYKGVGTSWVEVEIPIQLGVDEIALIWGVNLNVELGGTAHFRCYYEKKSVVGGTISISESDYYSNNPYVFWRSAYEPTYQTYGAWDWYLRDQVWFRPDPVIVVRKPRIVAISGGVGGTTLYSSVYYTKKEISRNELNKLLVKQHA